MQLVFVVGVHFREGELARSEFAPGGAVSLVRQPENRYDKTPAGATTLALLQRTLLAD